MKAITLQQPWASLVATGAKRIETRSWRTRHLGPIAIHASSAFPTDLRARCDEEPFRSALQAAFGDDFTGRRLPTGAVIAVARVVTCEPIGAETGHIPVPGPDSDEYAFGDYSPGRWMWLLDGVQPLGRPIPARGALGLWEWKSVGLFVEPGD